MLHKRVGCSPNVAAWRAKIRVNVGHNPDLLGYFCFLRCAVAWDFLFPSLPCCLAVLWKAGASKTPFPSGSTRRYTQVLEARHSGQGCRNPASKDGKLWVTTDAHVSTDGKPRLGQVA